MKVVFGIVLAALSMFGFAHQAKVVSSPKAAAVSVTFPKAPIILTAAPAAHSVPTSLSKPATSFVDASPSATAGAVLGTSTSITSSPYITQAQLTAQVDVATNALRTMISQSAQNTGLALQLPICFEVRALSGGLMSSTPE
jgi:hypothetical protein